jgi:hypothetical protein
MLALSLAAYLAGCGTKPAPVDPDANTPRFAGAVGQLERGADFVRFIETRNHQTVALDLSIPQDDFVGGMESGFSFFVIFDDCGNLPVGQKPDQAFCTGIEYNIANAAGAGGALAQQGGAWRLRGRFRVEHAPGQHQGLMSVRLDPSPSNR